MSSFATDAERWAAICDRDPHADGQFIYAVLSTGVCCRPTCRSRQPKPENVRFFADLDSALSAGFRPCKRCQPDAPPQAALRAAIERACQLIESAEIPPSLADLAAAVGMSPAHFHRLFRQHVGVTPHAYTQARRDERMRAALSRSNSVSAALYDAGFGSSAGFYEQANAALGMPPRTFRNGGRGEQLRVAVAPCSLGFVLVAATERGLCAIELGDSPEQVWQALEDRLPHATLSADDGALHERVAQVVDLIEHPDHSLDLPLDLYGTVFQRQVWAALRQIPAGRTVTYAQLAAQLGRPEAVRAVAGACAANRLAVVIPCHRVIGSDGELHGYHWGLERKRRLLEREGAR